MVTTLRELFAQRKAPGHDDKEAAVQQIAALIEQAHAIGHAHATSETHERGIAWGGKFQNALNSAWDIVSNFVSRIADWIAGQDADDVSKEDIIAEVDTLAQTVASVEIPSAIEQEVMEELQAQGTIQIRWIAQPGACAHCQANADMGSVPIGTDFNGDVFPPAHAHCRCSLALGDDAVE